MKTADNWFAEYAVSHQNETNKLIHWICVPTIYFTVIGLLWSIPFPWNGGNVWINWATIAMALAHGLFYFRLSATIGIGMLLVTSVMIYLIYLIDQAGISVLWLSVGLFVAAWIGQFIGHKIEGAKPSFFKDLQFLLVGPAWLLHFIYKRVNIAY